MEPFPFVVVERRILVSPWLHTRAGERLTAHKFVCGTRDDADVKSALAEPDSCIVWEGESAEAMDRAVVSHRAAWAIFDRDHASVLTALVPGSDPFHDVLADLTRAEVLAAMRELPCDSALLEGVVTWGFRCLQPEAWEFWAASCTEVTHWLLTVYMTTHFGDDPIAEILSVAGRAALMWDFVVTATPNGAAEHDAMEDACRARASAGEFREAVTAALGIVPTFVIGDRVVTELVEALIPQPWTRNYVMALARRTIEQRDADAAELTAA